MRRYGEGERLNGRYLRPALVNLRLKDTERAWVVVPWLSEAPSSPMTLLESLIADSLGWLTVFALCGRSAISPSEAELARDMSTQSANWGWFWSRAEVLGVSLLLSVDKMECLCH